MEDDTMVKQVSNVMHGEWGAGGVECSYRISMLVTG